MEKIKYKAIYKCRLCGAEFEKNASKAKRPERVIVALWKITCCKMHKCQDGRFGVCELIGTYEVKN